MYIKIENWVIVSYSKTELEWWEYTSTQWLQAWMIVIERIWDEIIAKENNEQIKYKLEIELKAIETELFTLNWRIKGWLELIEMWVEAPWDREEIEQLKTKAQELANKRIEIKTQIWKL